MFRALLFFPIAQAARLAHLLWRVLQLSQTASPFVLLEPGLKVASILPKRAPLAKQAPSATSKDKQARIDARLATLGSTPRQVPALV
jgi:hypothetical protein